MNIFNVQEVLSWLALSAVVLIVPLACLLGMFWRNGAVAVTGALALVGFVGVWLLYAANTNLSMASPIYSTVALYGLAGGALLLFGGWGIAVARVAHGRQWGWFVGLTVGVFATVAIFAYRELLTSNLCWNLQPAYTPPEILACRPSGEILNTLSLASCVIGPATLLAYALLAPSGRPRAARTLPEGLTIEPLPTPDARQL